MLAQVSIPLTQSFVQDVVLPSVFSLFYVACPYNYEDNDYLLKLLRAFVELEAVSADPSYGVNKKPGKRVIFSTHDCSSVAVPIDRDGEDSAEHQHKAIHALTNVVLCVKSLKDIKEKENLNIFVSRMTALINFLGASERLRKTTQNSSLLEKCSKSMGSDNTTRIEKVMKDYKKECEKILGRILGNEHGRDLLLAEQRLIEKLGNGIRYYLRKLFNGAPPRLSPKDIYYQERSTKFSRITKLVSMKAQTKAGNAAVDDGCISAVVSSALFHIKNFFGIETLLDKKLNEPLLKKKFFQNHELCFQLKGKPLVLDDDQLDQILSEIEYAYKFLAASRGCQFLVKLWTAPGVSEEIERQGGWAVLEGYASSLFDLELWKQCPDNSHLVALADQRFLLKRLKDYSDEMLPLVKTCEKELKEFEVRFRTNTQSSSILRAFPQIKDLKRMLDDGKERYENVPELVIKKEK